jgi:plastocyanin
MRRTPVVLMIALAALLAACTSTSAPGWTYAPPTEPPASQPAASGGASAAPSGAPSSGAPSSEAPAGNVVEISALGVQFEQKEVTAPADTAFTIRFDNKDAGIPHNVEIKDAGGQVLFKGDIFNGVAVKDYSVDPLPAGTYQFVCIVHPNMIGTLKVGG